MMAASPTQSRTSRLAARIERKGLAFYLIYRLILASLLILLFYVNWGPSILGQPFPLLYSFSAFLYLGFSLAGGIMFYWHDIRPDQQAAVAVFIDIIALTVIMHSSGGTTSGLGMLLTVSIAAGSLIVGGRTALLFAALASLAVIVEQVYAQINQSFAHTAYTQAGLLGAAFFAIALLAHGLYQRAHASEHLAKQRGLDLANMAELNEYIIQHMKMGIIAVDQYNDIRLMNETAWYLLGMPHAAAGSKLEFASPLLADRLTEWGDDPKTQPKIIYLSSGSELKPTFTRIGHNDESGTLIFLEDNSLVTEQAQQMKLASLGRLTASIAHEIRNPLSAINHAGQLLNESTVLDPDDQRLTQIITSNTLRVNEIIENVLQLSRRKPAILETQKLRTWIERFVDDLIRAGKISPLAIQLQVEPQDTLVAVDPTQLRQILVSLTDNALEHACKDPDTFILRFYGGITRESGCPFLDVIDNGPGIPQDTVRQIFEPFFTTRHNGTGLGLYIAKELSELNRIHLEYRPLPTGGSCFRMYFTQAPELTTS